MEKLVPQLRFPEFKAEWEKQKLLELSSNGFSNGAFNDPKKVGSGYRIINVKDMYVDGTINADNLTRVNLDEKEFSKNRVKYGDIFFTRSSLVKEGIAHSNVNLNLDDDLTFDGHLIRMRPSKIDSSSVFLYYNFTTAKAREQFVKRGKTTTMTTIGQDDIATVEIILPQLNEQTKIATFLTEVDNKLTALKQKKTLLEQYKKGVMQKIFSQELRFKDDSGNDFADWEEKKLGEVGSVLNGLTYSPDDISENGVLVLRSSNIKNGRLKFEDNVYVNKKDYTPVITNDILICVRNGSSNLIGKNTLVTKEIEGVAFGAFMSIYRSKSNKYLIHWFGSENFFKNVYINLGATINSINGSDLKKFKVPFPCMEEQTKIANFLSAIDKKINYCQEQIEKTQVWKKGLLQQMFV